MDIIEWGRDRLEGGYDLWESVEPLQLNGPRGFVREMVMTTNQYSSLDEEIGPEDDSSMLPHQGSISSYFAC